jgi:SAM-dependent methyltransferase
MTVDVSPLPDVVDAATIRSRIGGYAATVAADSDHLPDLTTDEYADTQLNINVRKTLDFIEPQIKIAGARSVLDVGCGMGTMVHSLREHGYLAYGVDIAGIQQRWSSVGRPSDSFFLVDSGVLELPFRSNSLDFSFSLGVIEHIGTSDGHADRIPEYHAIRRQWLREVYRVVKPGGHMLIGGPNRNFPIDVAHGLDSKASAVERWLSARIGASIHRIWGENFLWSYGDFDKYLDGLPYSLEPLSVKNYVYYSRVPAIFRPMVRGYVDYLPRALLGTGFNPWVAALITKEASSG